MQLQASTRDTRGRSSATASARDALFRRTLVTRALAFAAVCCPSRTNMWRGQFSHNTNYTNVLGPHGAPRPLQSAAHAGARGAPNSLPPASPCPTHHTMQTHGYLHGTRSTPCRFTPRSHRRLGQVEAAGLRPKLPARVAASAGLQHLPRASGLAPLRRMCRGLQLLGRPGRRVRQSPKRVGLACSARHPLACASRPLGGQVPC